MSGTTRALLAAALGMAGLGAGCGPTAAKLKPKSVTAIRLTPASPGARLCVNGPPLQLKVTAYYREGQPQETWTLGQSRDGKLPFETFEWGASLGSIDERGRVLLPADPFAVADRKVTVTARVPQRPKMNATLTLTPRFDCGGQASFSGRSGSSGFRGISGSPGFSGSSGDQPTSGRRGRAGGHGRPGGNGAHGPRITVSVAYVQTTTHGRLILVRVAGRYYLVDPAGAPFFVRASGGNGGSGGSGGRGGRGGRGGSDTSETGNVGGDGGDGGDGGSGGSGGDGGDGGVITVQYDPKFPELMKALRFDVRGGAAGRGGRGGDGGRAGEGGSSSHGSAGRDGEHGRDGADGRDGRDGRNGAIQAQVAPVDRMFADEIKRGIAIIVK